LCLSVAFTTAIISYNTDKSPQSKEDKKEVAVVVPQQDTSEENTQPTLDETTVESAVETAQTEAVKTPIAKATQQKYIIKEVSGNQTNNETVVKLEKVEENKLFASATASVSGGYAPLRVTFTHKSTENTKVHWNFGDKTESTLNSPTHTFIRPGKYVVTLTITDKKGNKTTDTKIIEAKEGSSITNISSVITPNGDGQMDEFTFVAKNIEEFELTEKQMKACGF
jgi:PKD repeat protein